MDWRNRNYYLVTTDYLSYKMRHEYYRIAAESLKIHSPYRHFKNCNGYDGEYFKHTGIGMFYVQEMLSCKKDESDGLEYELNKGNRNDGYGTRYCKLSKEMCGQ